MLAALDLEKQAALGLSVVLATAVVSYLIVRFLFMPLMHRAIERTRFKWDDILLDRALLHRIALAAPFLVVWGAISNLVELSLWWPAIFGEKWEADYLQHVWFDLLRRISESLLVLIVVLIASAGLTAVNKLYRTFPLSRLKPIKSYIQIAKIITWVLGIVVCLAVLMDQEVKYFVTGIGAMTAVLLLIFKDTILSLVASIQLNQNDLLRIGDWIEMPGQNIDGDVVEVALHTVKVKNFDNTITAVPTYSLIQESFRNWRGMSESGGRRIKRSIAIDMQTIRFLTDSEIERFSKFAPLRKYMDSKLYELDDYNANIDHGPDGFGDPRRLTNIGTLRAYIVEYLRAHPKLHHHGMTLLVRQLHPTSRGLPIEVYVFTNDTSWRNYENIQADIFDHLLSMLPEFGLSVFQEPSSNDLSTFLNKPAA